MPKAVDMTGMRCGETLTVLCRAGLKRRQAMWLAYCSACTRLVEVAGSHLRQGRYTSCGCLRNELVGAKKVKHGASGRRREGAKKRCTPEYYVWTSMRSRCSDSTNKSYHNYGGRGITVCARWRNSFMDFIADIGKRPSPRHQLDRIDNDGHYEPGNVRWTTARENSRNRRTTRLITSNGITKPLVEWSEESGIDHRTITRRLTLGWSAERAVSEPVRTAGSVA